VSKKSKFTFSRWIDQVADEFEAAWKKGGDSPSIQEFLEGYSSKQQHDLLRELILIDLAYRHQAGETLDLHDYLQQFPKFSGPEGIVDSELILQARQVTRKSHLSESDSQKTHLDSKTGDSQLEDDSHPSSIPRVIDKYQILDLVGEGAFGVVYKAIDTELSRTVAIKFPRSGKFLRPKDKERFKREARSAATLNHSGIVKVFDIVFEGSLPYIVSDFILGTTLAEYLSSHTISPRESVILLLKITEAVEHAHRHGLVHRDLKPSNILIDDERNPHITDFGLAKSESVDFTMTIDGQILGTPAYMSPEQARGESSSVDFRMDVYSLGAIFYELLTGEKPFRGTTQMVLQQVQHEQPQAPRKINERIPKDLETICLKCLEKDARLRFSTAAELAKEFGRFLRGDSILSRPIGKIETLWRKCKRNPVICVLSLLVVLTLVSGTVISSYFAFDARSQKKLADKERETAQQERDEAEKQKILEQFRSLRLNERNYNGWTTKANQLLQQARGKISPSDLRDQTVSTYVGIEAKFLKGFGPKGGASVAFDKRGQRLVIGGVTKLPNVHVQHQDGGNSRVWNFKTDSIIETPSNTGTGPVAFYRDQPVELVRESERTLVLRTIPKQETIRSFEIPSNRNSRSEQFQWTLNNDATTVAASVFHNDGSRTAWVWSVESGKKLHTLTTNKITNPGSIPIPEKADARIALSSDGMLVAIGSENGQTYVWHVTEGSLVDMFSSSQNTIQSLAFSPKLGRHTKVETKKSNVNDWMLAVGDSGGSIAVWDLESKTKISKYSGSEHAVYSLAFNGDSTILASGGRFAVRLWNVITGELLFGIRTGGNQPSTDYVLDLAFSSDGSTLVVASKYAFNESITHVHIWKLHEDWGIKPLRGLIGPVEKFEFSRNGDKLAAICHQWRLGVWNLQTGVLINFFDVPQGEYVDNAAIAFSRNGDRIAFSAGNSARLWDLKSGTLLNQWDKLPPGMQDHLVFDNEGRLLSIRFETVVMLAKPFENDRIKNPFVCRVRYLSNDSRYQQISESFMKFYHIKLIKISDLGDRYVVIGDPVEKQQLPRQIVGFDSFSGEKIWSLDAYKHRLVFSSQYDLVLRNMADSGVGDELRDFATGDVIRRLQKEMSIYGRDASISLQDVSQTQTHLFDLYRHKEAQPFLRLGFNYPGTYTSAFLPDNSGLVWSDRSSNVYLCDFQKVESMLKKFGVKK